MNKKLTLAALCAAFGLMVSLPGTSAAVSLKHQGMKDCAVCHTKENAVAGNQYVIPDDKTCIGCHGDLKTLAAKTAPKDPHDPNPHQSHHYGTNMSCTACHAEHKESRVLCNDCHTFPFGKIR